MAVQQLFRKYCTLFYYTRITSYPVYYFLLLPGHAGSHHFVYTRPYLIRCQITCLRVKNDAISLFNCCARFTPMTQVLQRLFHSKGWRDNIALFLGVRQVLGLIHILI